LIWKTSDRSGRGRTPILTRGQFVKFETNIKLVRKFVIGETTESCEGPLGLSNCVVEYSLDSENWDYLLWNREDKVKEGIHEPIIRRKSKGLVGH